MTSRIVLSHSEIVAQKAKPLHGIKAMGTMDFMLEMKKLGTKHVTEKQIDVQWAPNRTSVTAGDIHSLTP